MDVRQINPRLTKTTNLLLLLTAGTAGNLVIDADEAHCLDCYWSKDAFGSDLSVE